MWWLLPFRLPYWCWYLTLSKLTWTLGDSWASLYIGYPKHWLFASQLKSDTNYYDSSGFLFFPIANMDKEIKYPFSLFIKIYLRSKSQESTWVGFIVINCFLFFPIASMHKEINSWWCVVYSDQLFKFSKSITILHVLLSKEFRINDATTTTQAKKIS